ncbi:3,4-dihydroxy-2-butanone-4-phosphate synthase [Candidatus Woesearchaeota archaeon]|nr:3,4-dihydroxy-2-butanone-4-phosphate synthase [Candidatus Woesearchaeota archaeon]
MPFSNIKKAIEDFKRGKFVIVVDDKHRENEADLVLAAEKATPEKINFMIKKARGLICIPMLKKRLDELKLPPMTDVNTELHGCKFTISVDSRKGTTSGISAFDRAKTVRALVDKKTKPEELAKPGHVFPLICDEGGLKKRPGHTEAAIELCKLAGVYPAAVICEIVGEDGRMAKINEIIRMSGAFGFKVISIKNLIDYGGK